MRPTTCSLSLDRLAGIESVDAAAGRAWLRAGSKIHDLGGPLAEHGLALENQGDVDVQALAGAVSTGTHGTGPKLGSISTQVDALRIVTAAGDVIECSLESDAEMFRAAQVSLGFAGRDRGACGCGCCRCTACTRQCRREPLDACLAGLDERIRANRHFEFFWYPADDCAFTKTLNPTDRPRFGGPLEADGTGLGPGQRRARARRR